MLGGAWAGEREREGWWVSGNWLKVKNKAKNLGNLVILAYLGQLFSITGSNRSKNLGDLVILTYLGQIFYNQVK